MKLCQLQLSQYRNGGSEMLMLKWLAVWQPGGCCGHQLIGGSYCESLGVCNIQLCVLIVM
jgi:hypothetical protein